MRLHRRRHELQPFELAEVVRAVARLTQVVAQLGGQPLERDGVEQEPLQFVGEPGEHVLGEEVPVRADAAADVGDRGAALVRRQAGWSPG